jgi:hypothetical protein
MKKSWPLLALAALVSFAAEATPIRLDGRETNLQQVLNTATRGGVSSVDVSNDQVIEDGVWSISGGSATAMIQVELAGHSNLNRFGIYDIANPGTRVELFSGAHGAGAVMPFHIGSDGAVYLNTVASGAVFGSSGFGFYLQTPGGLWHSDSNLNADGADHMVAYQGQDDLVKSPSGRYSVWDDSTYLLGWEDLRATGWDQDYNDFVVFVSGVSTSVPEPTTFALMSLGLLGIGASRRRRSRQG